MNVSTSRTVLLLDSRDLESLLAPGACFEAVREAFVALADPALAAPPAPLHVGVAGGGFHAKAAVFSGGRAPPVVALKFNANFPGNPARHGLPTIQGALLLCSADDGRLLAVMDSAVLTALRTAAATALAAHHLARPDARRLALLGCGAQGFAHVQALAERLPLRDVVLHDLRADAAQALAQRIRDALDLHVAVAVDATSAVRDADVVVTCTPSTRPLLVLAMLAPGCFVAAVGADHPHKNEIAPSLMARAQVVVDRLEQCAVMGELHHALVAGVMRPDQVHAELAEVVAACRSGRTDPERITLFDSTGLGIQDAACAALAWTRAQDGGAGRCWSIDGLADRKEHSR